ncbi:MAG: phage baseplate assembly protein V [Kofleriaceae bacterium]
MIANARSHESTFYGVVSGIVEKNIDPDKEGRIKVSFKWFDDGTITKWCRCAQLYAGSKFGAFFVPEEGTEVLVAFMHGDMREPVILGGLYNRKLKPATDRQKDEEKDEKLIRTRGGHQLLFVDTQRKEKVVLQTKGGHKLEMTDGDDGTIEIKTDKGQRIVLDDHGKITIDAKTIVLGGDSFKAVLGEAMRDLFNKHTHPNNPGSTLPPNQQMGDSELSGTVRLK